MNQLRTRNAVLFILLSATALFAETTSGYQKATVTKQAGATTLYEFGGTADRVLVKPCGQLQAGQSIEFRVAGDKAYVRRESGGEYKCTITMRVVSVDANASPTYQKGTILGYGIRRDINVAKWSKRFRE
jgi:hypothetical protein